MARVVPVVFQSSNRVPRGSVVDPILFIIYVNDKDEILPRKASKFADDTKIASILTTVQEWRTLQRDLKTLTNWAIKWQMNFNSNKL